MSRCIFSAFLLGLLLIGCRDPVTQLRAQAIKSYPEWWTKPEQIDYLRRIHSIPPEYQFTNLELTDTASNKETKFGLYEWRFRFLRAPGDFIDVHQICYYDTDSVVMHDVKQERLHWIDLRIVDRRFSFRGIESDDQ